MSGFVFTYGQIKPAQLETMFSKIGHRGLHIAGTTWSGKAGAAQNYLNADLGIVGDNQNHDKQPAVPYRSADGKFMICFDGVIGNRLLLASELDINPRRPDTLQSRSQPGSRFSGPVLLDPFLDEKILLALYQNHGHRMTDYLSDAVFAFIISDGRSFFAARDDLGIKTMYYGRQDDNSIILASELKSVIAGTEEVYEFPPGSSMDESTKVQRFHDFPTGPSNHFLDDITLMTDNIHSFLTIALNNRIPGPPTGTGCLLSGGLDSSAIASIAAPIYARANGKPLKTFSVGVSTRSAKIGPTGGAGTARASNTSGNSKSEKSRMDNDIDNARIVADFLKTDHFELCISLEEIIESLPDIIYYLESFDPSLVRSAVSNYFVSRYARQNGISILLSGEGGDELFCGYRHMKQLPQAKLYDAQIRCLRAVHNNAALRFDRMNMCHSVRVMTPFISGPLLSYALSIPAKYKIHPDDPKIEKWILRKTFADQLPEKIVWRTKQEFSQGSGTAQLLSSHFQATIPDKVFTQALSDYPFLRGKEELAYFRLFRRFYDNSFAMETVGRWNGT